MGFRVVTIATDGVGYGAGGDALAVYDTVPEGCLPTLTGNVLERAHVSGGSETIISYNTSPWGGGREGGGERKRGRKREKNSIHKWEGERKKENKTAAVGVHIRKREIGEIVYKIKRITRNERERDLQL